MTCFGLGTRTRLLLSALLPAVLMLLVLEGVMLTHFREDLERGFEERGLATARQIGAAAEYAMFSGSHETLKRLTEGTRQADPAIESVCVLDRQGRIIVRSGKTTPAALPLSETLQIRSGPATTVLQVPIQQVALTLHQEEDPWHSGQQEVRPSIGGYILVEISRQELLARQRTALGLSLLVMLGGLGLAVWLSWRLSGGVLASLAAAHGQLQRQKEAAELLARTDALTGLANRRAFDEAAELEVQRTVRHNTPLALVLTDIDHFKVINDRFGHHVGDQVLQHFARVLSASVRNIDLVGRWGGEEFAILMPGTTLEEAAQAAERMRVAVENTPLPLADGELRTTASFGVAAFSAATPTMISLLGRADAALYRAKDKGRNRVERG